MIEREILQVLSSEITNSYDEVSAHFDVLIKDTFNHEKKKDSLQHILDFINCLGEAGEIIEFSEFSELCIFFSDNIKAIGIDTENDHQWQSLAPLALKWLKSVQQCLDEPENVELLGTILLIAQDHNWPLPFAEDAADGLAERLLNILVAAGSTEEGATAYQKLAIDPDAISLQFAEDVNLRLIDVFHVEVPEQVTALSTLIQSMSAGNGDIEIIRKAQRIAHTVKGTANIVGLTAAATLTHLLEDVFDYLVDNKAQLGHALGEILVESCDHLEEIIAAVCGKEQAPTNTYQILLQLNEWHAIITETHGDDNLSQTNEAVSEQPDTASADTEETVKPGTNKKQAVAKTVEGVMRVSSKSMNLLTSLAGEMSTSLVQIEGVMGESITQTKLLEEHNVLVNQRLATLQELLELKSVPVQKILTASNTEKNALDPLEMDEYNELHSAANALAETLRDVVAFTGILSSSLKNLHEMRYQLDDLSTDLNDTLMSTRLTPAESISARLQRGVRQTAKATDKKVKMIISGEDMLVDNQILDSIVDPLLHVLRNAVDHGIEEPEQRIYANKPEIGHIYLDYSRQGESLLIECRDDGRGFDLNNIREKAISSGLLDATTELSDKEWLALTLIPGFSTREQVSQVSGRGIGMDVVNRAVRDLRGSIDVSSEASNGSCITLRMPLTLISMHLLLFRLGELVFATPSSSLDQVLFSDAGEIQKTKDGYEFTHDEQHYKIFQLKALLGLPIDGDANYSKAVPLMLIKTDNDLVALEIDEALTGRSLVVNRFSDYVPRLTGTLGASILGDGSIAPVLDLIDLLRMPMNKENTSNQMPPIIKPIKAHKVLVVDDSISARGSMVDTLKNAGFETLTAVDGIDALTVLEEE
ncbi:MAG: Hpt domain-containing protein, partial [Alcanivoracaceae bacterium]|nr:Hpt domain-containing protein [Alcanivoracaceae bacterium]